MKLLFDHNLSPALAVRLADLFPGSAHVAQLALDRATDTDVWRFAGERGFVLVSKDEDMSDLATLRGTPPKVVWVRLGNCSTGEVEAALREAADLIRALDAAADLATLIVERPV